jgi:hypothetical protein
VPDALLYVSATDNCTPSNQLAFTQSPAANGNLCAGVNSVTVTVKDLAGNSSAHIIPLHIVGQISFLTNLFNTGVDNNRSLLPNGALDSHYALPTAPASTIYTHGSGTAVAATWPWDLSSTASEWIAPATNRAPYDYGINDQPPGTYTYQLAFTLPAAISPDTASISGRWAADNGAGMYLNGVVPAKQVSSIPIPNGYSHWTSFTTLPGLIVAGPNTMYFVVTNESPTWTYTGLRVELLHLHAAVRGFVLAASLLAHGRQCGDHGDGAGHAAAHLPVVP